METTTRVVKKKSWFAKEITATHQSFPEFLCIAGRPIDHIGLSTTEADQD